MAQRRQPAQNRNTNKANPQTGPPLIVPRFPQKEIPFNISRALEPDESIILEYTATSFKMLVKKGFDFQTAQYTDYNQWMVERKLKTSNLILTQFKTAMTRKIENRTHLSLQDTLKGYLKDSSTSDEFFVRISNSSTLKDISKDIIKILKVDNGRFRLLGQVELSKDLPPKDREDKLSYNRVLTTGLVRPVREDSPKPVKGSNSQK